MVNHILSGNIKNLRETSENSCLRGKCISFVVSRLAEQIPAIIIFILFVAAPVGSRSVVRAQEDFFRNRVNPNNVNNLPIRGINNFPPPNTPYILGGGDRINVNIFEVEEYSGEYLVLVDGTVSLPLVGNIGVGGLTLPQASQLINQQYSPFLKRPFVTVTLIAPRATKVAVAGEVSSPGSYEIKFGGNQDNPFPTLTDVIKLAGGITPAADISQVYIRRFFEGVEQIYSVDLLELLKAGNLDRDVFLRDGDEIIIATKQNIDRQENLQLLDANFGIRAVKPVDVAVVGQVFRPGTYKIEPESDRLEPPRVSQALQQAGGINGLADIRNVRLTRPKRDGSIELIEIDYWNLLTTGDITQDIVLQQGDSIFVPKVENVNPAEAELQASANFAPEAITIYVVGEIAERSGPVEVPLNTTLNEALIAAGYFDFKRANMSSVMFLRLNEDGQVVKQDIKLDLSQSNAAENNPILRQNDAIIVSRSGLTAFSDTLDTLFRPITGPLSILQRFIEDLRSGNNNNNNNDRNTNNTGNPANI